MNVAHDASSPRGPAHHESLTVSQWRMIVLASLGGSLEFYDFIVYGVFAQYIAAAFFPATDRLVSLILTFSVFAVGYFARPAGGVILSHFGDKYGRRTVFILSLLIISVSTFAIGLLPTYAKIGVAAPILCSCVSSRASVWAANCRARSHMSSKRPLAVLDLSAELSFASRTVEWCSQL